MEKFLTFYTVWKLLKFTITRFDKTFMKTTFCWVSYKRVDFTKFYWLWERISCFSTLCFCRKSRSIEVLILTVCTFFLLQCQIDWIAAQSSRLWIRSRHRGSRLFVWLCSSRPRRWLLLCQLGWRYLWCISRVWLHR